MDASMWVAKTGLSAQSTRMTVIANNLANVNTTGFKKDRAMFEDLLYQRIVQAGAQSDVNSQNPTGLMLGTGTRVVSTEKVHRQGNMISTENALDVAIAGDGFLSVQQADGTIAYTRDGSVKLSSEGPASVGIPGAQGGGMLMQGSLEASNVNIVEEMVNMIETQRAYEINSKAISAADGMLRFLNNNL